MFGYLKKCTLFLLCAVLLNATLFPSMGIIAGQEVPSHNENKAVQSDKIQENERQEKKPTWLDSWGKVVSLKWTSLSRDDAWNIGTSGTLAGIVCYIYFSYAKGGTGLTGLDGNQPPQDPFGRGRAGNRKTADEWRRQWQQEAQQRAQASQAMLDQARQKLQQQQRRLEESRQEHAEAKRQIEIREAQRQAEILQRRQREAQEEEQRQAELHRIQGERQRLQELLRRAEEELGLH